MNIKQVIQIKTKKKIKAPHYWSFVRRIHRWPVVFPHFVTLFYHAADRILRHNLRDQTSTRGVVPWRCYLEISSMLQARVEISCGLRAADWQWICQLVITWAYISDVLATLNRESIFKGYLYIYRICHTHICIYNAWYVTYISYEHMSVSRTVKLCATVGLNFTRNETSQFRSRHWKMYNLWWQSFIWKAS